MRGRFDRDRAQPRDPVDVPEAIRTASRTPASRGAMMARPPRPTSWMYTCSLRASIADRSGFSSSAAICGAAKEASVVSATIGFPAASAMPRAAATPTRIPVKLPGPIVTAIRSSSANSSFASLITWAIIGIRASAWPRSMAREA